MDEGTLKGFDNLINLIIENSHERVFSPNQGVERVELGLYVIRGDNVSVIGELDEDLDKRIDFSVVMADPLNHVVN